MVIVLVKWYIKKGKEDEFINEWEKMKPKSSEKLFREFFGIPNPIVEEKFHTLDLESPHYSCYINFGVWDTLKDFDEAIGNYIPNPTLQDNYSLFKIFNFEFKMRERLVLDVQKTRGGNFILPKADLK